MDPNNPTGTIGVVAVDKLGWQVLFLDPMSYDVVASLPMPARPHEVAVSPDHRTAYVSIYGSGVYGNNPEPGHLIAIIDLVERRRIGDIDIAPHLAPHALMWGCDGYLYASCDSSGVVAGIDVKRRRVVDTIDADSHGCHMITMLPDGDKLYAENEDDRPFVSVLNVARRELVARPPMPNGAAGISASPDGRTVLVTDNQEPRLAIVDTASDAVIGHVVLHGHTKPAQRVRWSPDGRYVLVTSMEEPLVTVLSDVLQRQETFETSEGPMGVAFHPDGQTALVANHNAGRVSVVDLATGRQTRDLPAGRGVETLAFF